MLLTRSELPLRWVHDPRLPLDCQRLLDAQLQPGMRPQLQLSWQGAGRAAPRARVGAQPSSAPVRVGAADVQRTLAGSDAEPSANLADPFHAPLSPLDERAEAMEALTAGSRVQARFGVGNEYFWGRIKSVNVDGTFDVQYDNGTRLTGCSR